MAGGIYLNDAELDAMNGLPHAARSLYVELRRRMDFHSGLVGAVAGAAVSWRALYEALYVEPHSGPVERWPEGQAGKEKTRRTCTWLERAGLVKMRGDRNALRLVFLLPMASLYSHVRKQPDINPTGYPDRGRTEGKSTGTRQGRGGTTRHTSEVRDREDESAAANRLGAAASYVFPQTCTQDQRRTLIEIAAQARLTRDEAQRLLDELRDAMSRKRVEHPLRMFRSMVQQLRDGTFAGLGVRAARSGGKALSREEAQLLNQVEGSRR